MQQSRIQLLSPSVREKIAAGEVIERPASVVKELVENSLDAGATEVAVILEDGGKALIEVIDNGHGMGAGDLGLCIQRHATSKIRDFDDLDRLGTLGFRGEALPSVAAVSELSILSRPKDTDGSSTAHELVVPTEVTEVSQARAEAVTFGHFLGSPHGTRIRARGLFSQIPARLKFLKSQAAEVAQVREWLERLALTHPHVGFRLVSNDRTVLTLRPQDEAARVRAILADGEDYPVISASNDLGYGGESGVRVRAHWLQGLSTPQMRKVIQVVNRRAVRDRMVQQAVLAPFRQALLPGQFPAIAVFIEVDPGTIDVNAHPTKTEIRFLKGRDVFHAVESMIASMIASNGAPAFVASSEGPPRSPGPSGSWQFNRGSQGALNMPNSPRWQASEPVARNGWNFSVPPTYSETTSETSGVPRSSEEQSQGQPVGTRAREGAGDISHPFHPNHFAGILFNTYIMYDLGDELGMIDQHAAHERIRYERLRSRILRTGSDLSINTQHLLIPEAVKFDADSRIQAEERIPWLEKLGFEAELFGEDTVLFRGVPAEWGIESLRIRLKNLMERLIGLDLPDTGLDAGKSQLIFDETLFEALASEACHSAIRAGDRLDPVEATALVEELFQCEHPWNCPHGRPTVVRVPRGRLEEWFQRRVPH